MEGTSYDLKDLYFKTAIQVSPKVSRSSQREVFIVFQIEDSLWLQPDQIK